MSTELGCLAAAKELARRVYADPTLRPGIDEPTARALVSEEPTAASTDTSPKDDPLGEIREVVESIGSACPSDCRDSSVGRRLVTSLGRELRAELVVLVRCPASGADSPQARLDAQVLRTSDGSFAPVTIAPRSRPDQPTDWGEAIQVLRALLRDGPAEPLGQPSRAEPAPARTARHSASSAPATRAVSPELAVAPEEEDDGIDFISSPWFWGGLGAVVAVGVTVIALSQTSLNDPGVVQLQGRVSP